MVNIHNTDIVDVNKEGAWVNITATVLRIWDNKHPAIRQVGLLKDDTGIIKFVSWEKSDLPLVQEGIEYEFTSLVVGKYEDYYSVALNSETTIARASETKQAEVPTV